MKLGRISVSATIAALGVVATVVLGAGTAAAAPSGTSATETIGQLKADGNNVVVNKVGTGPLEQCSVTSVRSVEQRTLPTSNPLIGIPVIARQNTVHVGLNC